MPGPYDVRFHPGVSEDFSSIPRNVKDRILTAIDQRLAASPDRYGERLRKSLRGYWNLQVGDYRVVYEILARQIRVFGIKRHGVVIP